MIKKFSQALPLPFSGSGKEMEKIWRLLDAPTPATDTSDVEEKLRSATARDVAGLLTLLSMAIDHGPHMNTLSSEEKKAYFDNKSRAGRLIMDAAAHNNFFCSSSDVHLLKSVCVDVASSFMSHPQSHSYALSWMTTHLSKTDLHEFINPLLINSIVCGADEVSAYLVERVHVNRVKKILDHPDLHHDIAHHAGKHNKSTSGASQSLVMVVAHVNAKSSQKEIHQALDQEQLDKKEKRAEVKSKM